MPIAARARFLHAVLALTAVAAPGAGAGPEPAQFFGFESSEGYTAGPIHDQNDWLGTPLPTGNPTIAGAVVQRAVVYSGAQAFRLADEPSAPNGSIIGAVAPMLDTPIRRGSLSMQTRIDDLGGADYNIVGQTISGNARTFQVRFRFSGTIQVLDFSDDGPPVFIDTGHEFRYGEWAPLRIDFDLPAEQVSYFYDDALVYESDIFSGTDVDQLAFYTDGRQDLGEPIGGALSAMYLDDVALVPAPGGAAVFAAASLLARRRRGLLAQPLC